MSESCDYTSSTAVEEHLPFWDTESVPSKDHGEFVKRITSGPRSTGSRHPPFHPNANEYSSWINAPNPDKYTSFGSDGVTASVNAYGNLIQFSAYFDVGTSGMFSADQAVTDEPYWVVERLETLFALGGYKQRTDMTYGLMITGLILPNRPDIGYVHNRWPRYTFDGDEQHVTIQWMVHNKTVLQQYLIKNTGQEQRIGLNFAGHIHIRELEYLSESNRFNSDWGGHCHTRAPNGYGWVLTHPFGPDTVSTKTRQDVSTMVDHTDEYSTCPSRPEPPDETEHNDAERSTPLNCDTEAIVVLVSIFVDGTAIEWESPYDGGEGTEVELLVKSLDKNETTEVIVAYQMIHLSNFKDHGQDWTKFLISYTTADVSQHLISASATFKELTFFQEETHLNPINAIKTLTGLPTGNETPVNHIDFVIQRTLEHILSVCAIPVNNGDSNEDAAIALTCGDISGHRICSSASFFAFGFLLEISKLLEERPFKGDSSFELLRKRLKITCRGHLTWLSKIDKEESGCFDANYWVNGRIFKPQDDNLSFIPDNSFTDSAYQIIKAAEFANIYNTEIDQDISRLIVFGTARDWIRSLDESDKRGSSAWPHAQVEGYNKYRLSDHFWIWRALKAIGAFPKTKALDTTTTVQSDNKLMMEECRPSKVDIMQPRDDRKEADDDVLYPITEEDKKLFKRFTAGDIQRDILRQFTAENDVSKRRMLAMTRSPRETRFLFHASDTSLFYGLDLDFFLRETPFNEVWENTLKAQLHHSENSETGWENLIRYALAIMIGARHRSINKRLPKDLVVSSLNVLFRATSPNGLFHGQIDSTTKEPTVIDIEDDKDFFFHATFEIPFILLTNKQKLHLILTDKRHDRLGEDGISGLGRPRQAQQTHDQMEEFDLITTHPKRQSPVVDRDYKSFEISSVNIINNQSPNLTVKALTKSKPAEIIAMKKTMPFNSLIDQSSIVELKEEWLYNYPTFLMIDKPWDGDDLDKELRRIQAQAKSDTASSVIATAAHNFLKRLQGEPIDAWFDREETESWITDVPKQKELHKSERRTNKFIPKKVLGNNELWNMLSAVRTATKAKKRLVWLLCASEQTALVCFLTSPEEEKSSISLFFDRHSHYENWFFDDTAMALNLWETELHLSFYQLVDGGNLSSVRGLPKLNKKDFPNTEIKLVKASIGFRFLGDFFDRYWTCHLIEHIPIKTSNPTHPSRALLNELQVSNRFALLRDSKDNSVKNKECLRQRKVLELYLFGEILEELVGSTKTIYTAVETKFPFKHGGILSSVLNSNDYFNFNTQWQSFQQILQVVEEELSDVLLTISKWKSREKDRGQERPRWTRNDERKYRQYIRKLEGMNRLRIRDLQKYCSNIRSLKETLKSNQEQISNDLNLRGSENIRFFTYVTVVFLPLGFAASIFSMGDEPPSSVLIPMVVCATIALLLTAVALVNARRLNFGVGKLTTIIHQYSKKKMNESSLFQTYQGHQRERRKRREDEEADPENVPTPKPQWNRRREAHKETMSWHFWFWLAYIFVEFPARRIAVAFQNIKNSTFTTWRTYLNLALGVFLLPVFIFSFLIQIAQYNIFDLFQFCWEYIKYFNLSDNTEDSRESLEYLSWLTYPLHKYRPLRELNKQREVSEQTEETHQDDSSEYMSE